MTQNDIDFINQNNNLKLFLVAKMMQGIFDQALTVSVAVNQEREKAKRSGLPVMFTGRRHGSGLVWFKKPRTIQERRQIEAVKTDDEIIETTGRRLIVRAKRINLPNGREDHNKTVQRSWKEHRKTQYK